jgi:hypothetical protein
LSDRPIEIDIAVVADVVDLHADLVADVPLKAFEAAVQFAPVEESGDVADVDEHAEVGVPVHGSQIEAPRRQL